MIYDYLFFKSYQLGKRSRNFEDIPVLAGVIWVGACFMFNIFTIAMLLEALGYSDSFVFEKKYKYIFSLGLEVVNSPLSHNKSFESQSPITEQE